jgi:hypothetical protein
MRHRLAPPLHGIHVTLRLSQLDDDDAKATLVSLAALLAAAAVLGLFALYRTVAVRLQFAERQNNFVSADADLMTRPNYDGPLRVLPSQATVTTSILEFHPDGTAQLVVSNVPQAITTPVTITVQRKTKTKAMTINGAGKIQIQ